MMKQAKRIYKRQLENFKLKYMNRLKNIIENYKEGVTTEEELLQVKEYYFKKKYLERLQQD